MSINIPLFVFRYSASKFVGKLFPLFPSASTTRGDEGDCGCGDCIGVMMNTLDETGAALSDPQSRNIGEIEMSTTQLHYYKLNDSLQASERLNK